MMWVPGGLDLKKDGTETGQSIDAGSSTGNTPLAPIRDLMGALRSIVQELRGHGCRGTMNSDRFVLGARSSVQIACYPGNGARYARHYDSFRYQNKKSKSPPQHAGTAGELEQEKRLFTLLYYLNENWQPEHGGVLRLHDGAEDPTFRHWDVEPRCGCVLCTCM